MRDELAEIVGLLGGAVVGAATFLVLGLPSSLYEIPPSALGTLEPLYWSLGLGLLVGGWSGRRLLLWLFRRGRTEPDDAGEGG